MIEYIIAGVILLIIILIGIFWILKRMKGKIDLTLDKYSFSEGENVTGKIILKLNKEVFAKELKIGLIGIGKETVVEMGSGGARTSQNSRNVFEFYQPILGEKTYPLGESSFNFELKIPADLISKNNIKNPVMESVVKSMQALSGGINNYIEWYIVAKLDVSGFDLVKKVKIQISKIQ